MLHTDEVWRSNWSNHSTNILTFQKFIYQISPLYLALSSIKIKSEPIVPGNHRTPIPHPYSSQQSQCLLQSRSGVCGNPT
ncbi:hypothetical protein TNCV_751921 [Trichonephila clavipes]|uniref:Uncharacterized protein n=1 Tax=Trichonephila clavipes TaxID=2585209 RepID=A0A8X6WB80_TRICX|nr:hypothetical protein TNCV_751921 [Trichonephila clavipes]